MESKLERQREGEKKGEGGREEEREREKWRGGEMGREQWRCSGNTEADQAMIIQTHARDDRKISQFTTSPAQRMRSMVS